jgi:hypothetical protein
MTKYPYKFEEKKNLSKYNIYLESNPIPKKTKERQIKTPNLRSPIKIYQALSSHVLSSPFYEVHEKQSQWKNQRKEKTNKQQNGATA